MKLSNEFTDEEIRSLIINLAVLTAAIEKIYTLGDESAKYLSVLTNRLAEIGKENDTKTVNSSYTKCKKLMEKLDSVSRNALKMNDQLNALVDCLDDLLDEQTGLVVDK